MGEEQDRDVKALARAGGIARARALTPEERRASAQKAARARWESRSIEGVTMSHFSLQADEGVTDFSLNRVEVETLEMIAEKAATHIVSPNCPCDTCVDSVMQEMRTRYTAVLQKIDADARLDKEELTIFRLFIGEKPNRWTKIYRKLRQGLTAQSVEQPMRKKSGK
jgi:hypothetical protein